MRVRALLGLLLAAILFAAAWTAAQRGAYGFMLFVFFPSILGAISAWVFQPEGPSGAAMAGMMVNALALGSFLLLGQEGLLCILMAAPLALPLGALGGWLMYRAQNPKVAASTMLLLLPVSFLWDVNAKPPVFEVSTSVTVNAPAARVWRNIVAVSDLPEPHEWYFRAGVAYPQRSGILGTGVGATRYCQFSTGPFVEPVIAWEEPRLLRFDVTRNPPPMHEWSPYHIQPKHLEGYMVSKQGEFRLTALGDQRTLVQATTWYTHGLWPAEYWKLWSNAIIHRIHRRVLDHIRKLSEDS